MASSWARGRIGVWCGSMGFLQAHMCLATCRRGDGNFIGFVMIRDYAEVRSGFVDVVLGFEGNFPLKAAAKVSGFSGGFLRAWPP